MTSEKLYVLYDEQHAQSSRTTDVLVTRSLASSHDDGVYIGPLRRPVAIASSNGSRRVVCSREVMGSLRPEAPPIKLFSSDFLGLAVTAFLTGFVVTLLKNGYLLMLGEVLRVRDESYPTKLIALMEWPVGFALSMGFLSDCHPINGRRRKPYMIIGWALAGLMMVAVAVIDFTLAHSWRVLEVDAKYSIEEAVDVARFGPGMIALSLGVAAMLMLVYIATLSMTVEFAQREMLLERGKLQAMYFILFFAAATFAQTVTITFVMPDEDGHVRSKLSLGATALILAGACFLPIPFLVKFLDEPHVSRTVHFSVQRRVHELWRFCHQDVVGRILIFIVAHVCLLGMYNLNARKALAEWCSITPARLPAVSAASNFGYCLALIVWAMFMVNYSWVKLAAMTTMSYIALYAIFTAIITYDVARSYPFYVIFYSLLDMPRGWVILCAVLFSTEVADHGREGAILGLVVGLQTMIAMLAHVISGQLGTWLPFTVTVPQDTELDTSQVRNNVMAGAGVAFGINLLAIAIVFVLPLQKLDTQRRRAFGGYNRFACYGVAITFVVLFFAICGLNTLNLILS